jgi:hypothetical protein
MRWKKVGKRALRLYTTWWRGPPTGRATLRCVRLGTHFRPGSSCDFILMFNFCLYNPRDYPRFVYRVLVVFCFDLFLSGVVLSFRGIMASANNDKGKEPLEEDHQDPKLKEGQMTRGSRAREPTFVGSINADMLFLIICRDQYHQSQT